jgi:predicted nucleotidyltransferase component of viral defense system
MSLAASLTAWQPHAPWPKRSQLEQDLRISRGVAAIFSDETLTEHLAMRGGTVLHKGHLAPAARYSEDIDFVLVKPMPNDRLERQLRRVLTPVLGKPYRSAIEEVKLALRNAFRPSKVMRIIFRFVPLDLQRLEIIKVEVNLDEAASLYPMVDVVIKSITEDAEIVDASARSYDINEMLGTKTRALLQRDQGRDLFDLHHAWQLGKAGLTPYAIDGARAMAAFTWYMEQEGTRIRAADANRILSQHLKKPAFRNDMNNLLRPGLPKFDPDAAAETVRASYFSHLPR